MDYIAQFIAGVFLCNCVPHLVAGLQGTPFPSPFAKPPGKGDSPPPVNFLWGLLNLLLGTVLLAAYPVTIGLTGGSLALLLGILVLGIGLSLHFGAVQARKRN